jgi:serine/threonine protein kinase
MVETPILKAVSNLSPSLLLPRFHESFWEKGSAGSHLCFVMNPLSTSIHDLQQDADNQRFPVHVVQRIVWCVASSLKSLHDIKIMHGQIKAENLFFSTATQINRLKPVLDSKPPSVRKIKKFTTVISQPLQHTFKWDDKNKVVADWPIHLDGFGHAQHRSFKPEPGVDYLSAPETLLQEASCSPQTDIWMLGCLAFTLLTGKPPFQPNENGTKQITDMCALLEDDVPEEWLGDSNIQNRNAEDPGPVTSIEARLAEVLQKDEIPEVLDFLKCCLRLDPKKRPKAGKCVDHEWLSMANACSCCC